MICSKTDKQDSASERMTCGGIIGTYGKSYGIKSGKGSTFSWTPFLTSSLPGAAAFGCCPAARISCPCRCGAQSVCTRDTRTGVLGQESDHPALVASSLQPPPIRADLRPRVDAAPSSVLFLYFFSNESIETQPRDPAPNYRDVTTIRRGIPIGMQPSATQVCQYMPLHRLHTLSQSFAAYASRC